MPTLESMRIVMEDPTHHPGQLAKTIVVETQSDPHQTLGLLREAWREVAKFGYAGDDDVPLPESDDDFFVNFPECIEHLPRSNLRYVHMSMIVIGIWWSSTVVGDRIKIDIRCDAMPTDTYRSSICLRHAAAPWSTMICGSASPKLVN